MRRRFKTNVSKAEKEILSLLQKHGYETVSQFKIEGLPYFYDFYFPKLNLLLEYNGSYYHASPQKYKAGTLINMVGRGKLLVDYIWDKDALKIHSAEKLGFRVKVLWEHDYKKEGWSAVLRTLAS